MDLVHNRCMIVYTLLFISVDGYLGHLQYLNYFKIFKVGTNFPEKNDNQNWTSSSLYHPKGE